MAGSRRCTPATVISPLPAGFPWCFEAGPVPGAPAGRIARAQRLKLCAQIVNALVFALTQQGHDVEVFMQANNGIDALLRTYFQGPIHPYEDLPGPGPGSGRFDVVAYAEWYPADQSRPGWAGDSKLLGARSAQTPPVRRKHRPRRPCELRPAAGLLEGGYTGRVWVWIHEPSELLPWQMPAPAKDVTQLSAPDQVTMKAGSCSLGAGRPGRTRALMLPMGAQVLQHKQVNGTRAGRRGRPTAAAQLICCCFQVQLFTIAPHVAAMVESRSDTQEVRLCGAALHWCSWLMVGLLVQAAGAWHSK